MPALFVEKGYGQVEANRLSGITFGHIEAQAPAYESADDDATPIAELENGMFLCVVPNVNNLSGATMGRVAVLPGEAPATAMPYLVYSEKKLYDEREGYCDFVDRAKDKVDGLLYPRLIGMTPDSDVYTTNTLNVAKFDPTATIKSIGVGDILYVGDDGYLTKTRATNTAIAFQVVKVYTMPDNQTGVKLQSIVQAPAPAPKLD